MRRQYHFQPSERGLLAWDVHRLIEAARGLPVTKVPLDQIREIDEVYWFDDGDERPTCRKVLLHLRLIEEASLEHPILLASDGRVMDGMHRVAKALREGRADIAAIRFETDPPPDHVGVAPADLSYEERDG